jgi:hypothetical protein
MDNTPKAICKFCLTTEPLKPDGSPPEGWKKQIFEEGYLFACPDHINERYCRVCGCTENNACKGGCWWVEENLCSSCKVKIPIKQFLDKAKACPGVHAMNTVMDLIALLEELGATPVYFIGFIGNPGGYSTLAKKMREQLADSAAAVSSKR